MARILFRGAESRFHHIAHCAQAGVDRGIALFVRGGQAPRILVNEDMAFMLAAFIQEGEVVPLSSGIALKAANLSLELKLPMADSIILATARHYDATLWTQDADFEGIEGVRYTPRTEPILFC